MGYWKRVLYTLRDCFCLKRPSLLREVDVVIHIGAPKTGSSAIQRFCLNNREQLLRAGFYYPRHFVDKNGVSGGHSFLGKPLGESKQRKASLYFRALLLVARLRGKTLLLSSESFYRNARRFRPLLQGLNVRVIGWFRHPVEALVSHYNQSVKRHFWTFDISEMLDERFMKNGAANLNGRRLRLWADAVGDSSCTFLPYSKQSISGDSGECEAIERAWLGVLEVDAESAEHFVFDEKRVNRSYVQEALELKRLLNLILSPEETDLASRVDWALQDYSDNADACGHNLGGYLKPEQVKKLNDRFSRASSILAKRFPTLNPILEQNDAYELQTVNSAERSMDLFEPLSHFKKLYPEDYTVIQCKVRMSVEHELEPRGELLRLGRLLNVYSEREFE